MSSGCVLSGSFCGNRIGGSGVPSIAEFRPPVPVEVLLDCVCPLVDPVCPLVDPAGAVFDPGDELFLPVGAAFSPCVSTCAYAANGVQPSSVNMQKAIVLCNAKVDLRADEACIRSY